MAFNNWDKLEKAQRDFPKPKYANSVVDKALKKQPKNPFLLAWKAELLLSVDEASKAMVQLHYIRASAIPGLTDTRLLAYFYTLCAETTRRTQLEPNGIDSVGKDFLQPWQAAAKATERKADRLQLWDVLFTTASREDCWDDVLFAVGNYQKEGLADKRQIYYIRILVQHLSAEQKRDRLDKHDQMTQILFKLARAQMEKAFKAPPDDPIAVKDIRDLRFMAEIYARQGQVRELIDLWKTAPEPLVVVMGKYRDELKNLTARLLLHEGNWELLETYCLGVIEAAVKDTKDSGAITPFGELCASRWDIWQNYLTAIKELYSPDEAQKKLMDLLEKCTVGFEFNERPIHRTTLVLFQTVKAEMLGRCKAYWESHSATPSCFSDLRFAVEPLPLEQQQEFHRWIQVQTQNEYGSKEDLDEAKLGDWQQAQLNILKFDYLLTISIPPSPSTHAKECLATKAIKFCFENPEVTDGAFVAIYTLLNLHYETNDAEMGFPAFEVAPSTRILLQATMLARHFAARDRHRENRTLSLLAARLHLNLGLGKSAFQLYSQSKLKEMLLDTLSLYVLSRISMTHPFEVKGYQGFSADDELAKVIGTIEKMERKTDTFIYTDLPSFIFDQVPDSLFLKRRLKSSLTKHLCITERRRIARLKGQSVDHIPRLSHSTLDHISNNFEPSAFPNYGRINSRGPYRLVMPNPVPKETWMIKQAMEVEAASQVLYREDGIVEQVRWLKKWQEDVPRAMYAKTAVNAERLIDDMWRYLQRYATTVKYSHTMVPDAYLHPEFAGRIEALRKGMQSLVLSETTTLKPEEEPAMFCENMLLACYTKLEVLRASNKYFDMLRELVVHAKSNHPLKKEVSLKWVLDATKDLELCFKAIQDVAQSYITVIRKRGLAAIKAQVQSGATGEQLCKFLTKEDIEYYANEYVESAVEGWSGILKVKLR
ncbi:hypothetical protein NX059_007411 [Plenodomus lindquistii]|nr:hypothetical protein NX059_007411 [Plenodomus lindquistii]